MGKLNSVIFIVPVILLIIGAIFFMNYISFGNIKNIHESELLEKQALGTEFIAFEIEQHIHQTNMELVSLTNFPTIELEELKGCDSNATILTSLINPLTDSLLLVDKLGEIIGCGSPDDIQYLGLNINNKDYFSIPKDTKKPYISGLIRQGNNLEIIVSAPLFKTTSFSPYPNVKGEFAGVLLSIVDIDKLYLQYIHPFTNSGKNSLFLIYNEKTGKTIAKDPEIPDYDQLKLNFNSGIPTKEISTIEGFGVALVSSSQIFVGNELWGIVIITPMDKVNHSMNTLQNRHLFGVILALLLLFVVFFLIRALYKSKINVELELDKTKLTLQKLGISVGVETNKYVQTDVNLESGKAYLVKDDQENTAHEFFISALNEGYSGIGVVREDPRKLRKKYALKKTAFIWMANKKIEGTPCETNVDNICTVLEEFMHKSKKSVILLDRFDFLVSENSSEKVLKVFRKLIDMLDSFDSILIISVNPVILDEKLLTTIELDSIDLLGKELKNQVSLSNQEKLILKMVNENNIINKLISFNDITVQLNITKPTTRSRIKRLQLLGLLQVEQRGRYKSLKITSAGRRFI